MRNRTKYGIVMFLICLFVSVNAYALKQNKKCDSCPRECTVTLDSQLMKSEFKACSQKCGCKALSEAKNATKEDWKDCLKKCGCDKIKMDQLNLHKEDLEKLKAANPNCKDCSLECSSINGFHDKMGKYMQCAEKCGCVNKSKKPNMEMRACAEGCGCTLK